MAIFGKNKKEDKKNNAEEAKEGIGVAPNESEVAREKEKSHDSAAEERDVSFWAHRKTSGNPEDILRHPRITEKTAILSGAQAYTFLVDRKYGKKDVKAAFENVYEKVPAKVHIVNVRGKKKRTRTGVGRTNHKKKAIIFLNKKDKIDFV